MSYTLTTYDGQNIENLTPEQARKIAEVSGLMEIEVNSKIHYVNASSVSKITDDTGVQF